MIVKKFEETAEKYRDHVAVKTGKNALTYHQLNCLANRIAHAVHSSYDTRGIERDKQTVALLFQHGAELAAAMLAVLKAGKIYVPFDPTYPPKRLEYMIEFFAIRLVVTDSQHMELAKKLAGAAKNHIPLINTDNLPHDISCENPRHLRPEANKDRIAYILQTSGSTGKPKGVIQTCANLYFFVESYMKMLKITSKDRVSFLSSISHDGAVEDVYPALLSGAALYPYDIKTTGTAGMAKWLSQEQITVYHSVPTVFRYFAASLHGPEWFPHLRLICMGGETLRGDDIRIIRRFFPQTRLSSMYGQTESSVNTIGFIDTDRKVETVTLGKPLTGITLLLINEQGEEVEELEEGEIYVGSPYLSPGYWKDPEASKAVFLPDEELGRLYKTGDLGRLELDGQIVFRGRKDHQLKINGFRVEPMEIENYLLQWNTIKEAIVTGKDRNGETVLCAYIVSNEKVPAQELRQFLSRYLPEYMVPLYIVQLEQMPLTENGKLDRKRLPEPGTAEITEPFQAPTNEIEKKMAEVWQEVLNVDIKTKGINANFFHLGGHSLKATLLISKIHREFHVKIPLSTIFKYPTIKKLSTAVGMIPKDKYTVIEPVEKKEYYALSSAQKRLYFLHQLLGISPEASSQNTVKSTAYNMPYVFYLGKAVEKERLELIFKKLVARHESLRTSFITIENEPMQRVQEPGEIEFTLQYYDLQVTGAGNRCRWEQEGTGGLAPLPEESHLSSVFCFLSSGFIRPFDLSRAPLLRAGLLELPGSGVVRQALLIDMHHIISDGSSRLVLTGDFMSLYQEEELAPLRLHYKDFARWQNRQGERNEIKTQEEYWLNRFADVESIPRLNLPADFKRPGVFTFAGDHYNFKLEKEEAQAFKALGAGIGATLYMNILALLNVLFYKYSGQTDIIIGTGIAGRRHADLQRIIGMFVNTLPVRNQPQDEKPYNVFLQQVAANSIDAFENQDIQLEELVEKLELKRDPSRNPLFDVSIILQNFRDLQEIQDLHQASSKTPLPAEKNPGQVEEPGLADKDFPIAHHKHNIAKFDMTFFIYEQPETGEVYITSEYYTGIFKPGTVKRLTLHLKNVLNNVVKNPGIRLKDIDIISREERKQVLEDFNGIPNQYPQDKAILHLFVEQVEKTPHHVALVGQITNKEMSCGQVLNAFGVMQLSYEELNGKSNQLAQGLKEKGVRSDTVVGIMMGRSHRMIIGLLAIMKAGGAYLPIDPDYPRDRIDYMLKDSNVKVLVTSHDLSEKCEKLSIVNCQLLMVNEKPNRRRLNNPPKEANSINNYQLTINNLQLKWNNLAYIIYTSGSTGKPKGVMLEHRNLVNLIKYQYRYTAIDFSRVLQFASISFDVSFQEIFSTLLFGGQLVLINEEEQKNVPELFKRVETCQIPTLFLPSSFLKFVMNEERFVHLMPSCVKHIAAAGEQLVIGHRFGQYLQENHVFLHNHYGPSETHVVTTLTLAPGEEIPGLPSIGKPVSNTTIYILDRGMHPAPVGVPGELCVGGRQVGRGYLNNPELTGEKYCLRRPGGPLFEGTRGLAPLLLKGTGNNPMQPCSHAAMHYPIYLTGDLGRWLPDGNIEFLGRIDHQVKIRGFRVEPGEIENRLLNHPQIKECVVLAQEDEKRTKYLCAYIVPRKEPSVSELREYLSGYLPDYMIPTCFLTVEKIPVTSHGKIDKKALPVPDSKSRYTVPHSEIERKLIKIWQVVLASDTEPSSIGIDDNFFRMGGHSLNATILIALIHKELQVKVPLIEIFKRQTVRELATYILNLKTTRYADIEPVEKKEYYTLSSAQKRVYFLQGMDTDNTAYNLPMALPLQEDIQINKLESTLKNLAARHESLRTSFVMAADKPVQRIHEPGEIEFTIEYCDFPGFTCPFNLSQPPLMRAGLVKTGVKRQLLVIDMHHIISDGTSHKIFTGDLLSLYNGEELESLRIQYKDFAGWQERLFKSGEIKSQEDYWFDMYPVPGEIPRLQMPGDFNRPSIFTFTGDYINFILNREDAVKFKTLGFRTGATLFMNFLAALNALFYKYTGQEDIIMGTHTAGRRHAALQPVIGMFVNTLALRNYPAGEKTFTGFLKEIINSSIHAFDNQDIQFEDLVEKLELKRDPSRNPLFDVSLMVLDLEDPTEGISREDNPDPAGKEEKEYETKTTKFDMAFIIYEYKEEVYINIRYYTAIFKRETILSLAGHLKNVIKAVTRDPSTRLQDIGIITQEEKQQILDNFNDIAGDFPGDKTIYQLFKEQVEQGPDHIALVGVHETHEKHEKNHNRSYLSYKELNEQSDCLARKLEEKGVKPDTIVGIKVERSIEMIVGILGILKAGAAYLPIDPDYPEERTNFMLKDSGAEILLKDNDFTPKAFNNRPKGSYIPSSTLLPFYPSNHASLAYIIYTSGSTGGAKGVMVEQRNVIRLVKHSNYIDFHQKQRLLMTGSIGFDITTFEIWGALINGLSLYLADKEIILSVKGLGDAVIKYDISVLHLIPQLFDQVVDQCVEAAAGLEYFLVGGDLVRPERVNRLRGQYPRIKILHCYGPTENTTFSTALLVEKNYPQRIPIGKPISNSPVYILDRQGQLQPIGVMGELCTGGDGVARGYLNNPELTAERFLYRSYRSYKSYILYQTGDLARWLSDGNIEFLGRMDKQVKISGVRIEPREIENQMLKQDGIKEAVVSARESVPGHKYLCVYIVPGGNTNGDSPGKQPDIKALKKNLSTRLPQYLVPSYFVIVKEIPLTFHGKIDWDVLPEPGIETRETYIPPRGQTEEILVEKFSEILAIEKGKIGTADSFFELGGNSMDLIGLISKIRSQFAVEVPVTQIFENPRIKEIANLVKSRIQDEQHVLLLNRQAKKKLFCFPPGVGFGIAYNDLASLIPDYAVYGFNFIESDDRLEQYVGLITGLQPIGPYVLLGWSLAGRLILEVAHALEKRGYRVSDIILVDCLITGSQAPGFGERERNTLKIVEKNMHKMGLEFLIHRVKEKMEKYLKYNMQLISYELVHANIHLILSEQTRNDEGLFAGAANWKKLTGKSFFLYEGFGDHADMLLLDSLEKNAELIREILRKILATDEHEETWINTEEFNKLTINEKLLQGSRGRFSRKEPPGRRRQK